MSHGVMDDDDRTIKVNIFKEFRILSSNVIERSAPPSCSCSDKCATLWQYGGNTKALQAYCGRESNSK